MRKSVVAALMAVVLVAMGATSALAAPKLMASGGGKTHDGASFGFNAKDDEKGSFNYVGVTEFAITVAGKAIPVGSKFHGHCHNYTRVNFISNVEARLFAGCDGAFFVDGGPPIRGKVFLQAHVIDNGEPGRNDRACIAWGLNPSPGQSKPGLFVFDCGRTEHGNIQVKTV
jgi:hypothetical protein